MAPTPSITPLSASALKKQSLYATQLRNGTPFPQHPFPMAEQAQEVCDLLASVHGLPQRPGKLVDREDAPAGCGQVPSVLDALVRTILSQNTTSKNSTAAKRSMDDVYGRANYRAVLEGGEAKLEDAIRCGGLAKNKAKAILGVLRRCEERNLSEGEKGAELELAHLHEMGDEDAMKELISYDLVGVKTASCVLLFCLGRDSFAVDTHVHRITQSLGWLPSTGSVYSAPPSSPSSSSESKTNLTRLTSTSQPPTRDQTFYHLDALLPPALKYPLHSLLVRHGRGCVKCSANGVTTQDFIDTCPIEHLVAKGGRKKRAGGGKKGKVAAKAEDDEDDVPVKDEQGHIVGIASASVDKKPAFHPLADAPEQPELGAASHNPVKLEDDIGLPSPPDSAASSLRRSTRARTRGAKRVKYEDPDSAEEEDEQEEEEVKPVRSPAKRQRTLKAGDAKATKRAASVAEGKVKKENGSSVDRDEAEMSGRGWARGEMHGLEV
ncbi:hypothetical protein JCM10213_004396 [Rhodosporidiobolus nylandii]